VRAAALCIEGRCRHNQGGNQDRAELGKGLTMWHTAFLRGAAFAALLVYTGCWNDPASEEPCSAKAEADCVELGGHCIPDPEGAYCKLPMHEDGDPCLPAQQNLMTCSPDRTYIVTCMVDHWYLIGDCQLLDWDAECRQGPDTGCEAISP